MDETTKTKIRNEIYEKLKWVEVSAEITECGNFKSFSNQQFYDTQNTF